MHTVLPPPSSSLQTRLFRDGYLLICSYLTLSEISTSFVSLSHYHLQLTQSEPSRRVKITLQNERYLQQEQLEHHQHQHQQHQQQQKKKKMQTSKKNSYRLSSFTPSALAHHVNSITIKPQQSLSEFMSTLAFFPRVESYRTRLCDEEMKVIGLFWHIPFKIAQFVHWVTKKKNDKSEVNLASPTVHVTLPPQLTALHIDLLCPITDKSCGSVTSYLYLQDTHVTQLLIACSRSSTLRSLACSPIPTYFDFSLLAKCQSLHSLQVKDLSDDSLLALLQSLRQLPYLTSFSDVDQMQYIRVNSEQSVPIILPQIQRIDTYEVDLDKGYDLDKMCTYFPLLTEIRMQNYTHEEIKMLAEKLSQLKSIIFLKAPAAMVSTPEVYERIIVAEITKCCSLTHISFSRWSIFDPENWVQLFTSLPDLTSLEFSFPPKRSSFDRFAVSGYDLLLNLVPVASRLRKLQLNCTQLSIDSLRKHHHHFILLTHLILRQDAFPSPPSAEDLLRILMMNSLLDHDTKQSFFELQVDEFNSPFMIPSLEYLEIDEAAPREKSGFDILDKYKYMAEVEPQLRRFIYDVTDKKQRAMSGYRQYDPHTRRKIN